MSFLIMYRLHTTPHTTLRLSDLYLKYLTDTQAFRQWILVTLGVFSSEPIFVSLSVICHHPGTFGFLHNFFLLYFLFIANINEDSYS